MFGEELSENAAMLGSVRNALDDGMLVWAECGGLLWMSRSLDGRTMLGAVPADAKMTDNLTLGYRNAYVRIDNPVAARGEVLKGHEYHRSDLTPPGNALELSSRYGTTVAGYASERLFATYLHQHLGGSPERAETFVREAARLM